jgi:MHS family proline/betaine transporter-like MFS transporter
MRFSVKSGILIANVFQHYETSLFGWITPFLAPLLFPKKTGLEALLLTFAFLPLAYLAKPLGALFWGFLGDRIGRKPVLIITLIGMTCSTVIIGSLPLIENAWIILALCRTLQGFFSVGGEDGAALFLLEATPERRRPWISALYDATGILGIFLASFLVSFWGETHWRLLFWLGAFTSLVAIFLSKRAEEVPRVVAKASLRTLWEERFSFLQVVAVTGFSYANYFLVSVFLNGFLPQISSLTKQEVLQFNTHLLWLDALLLLGFGFLCKYMRKEKLMIIAALMAAFFTIPLISSLQGATWTEAALVRLILVFFGVALAAPFHAWKLQVLPTSHRFLVGGVASALGAKLFGAPMPLLSTWLVSQTGWVGAAGLPVVLLSLAAALAISRAPRSAPVVRQAVT